MIGRLPAQTQTTYLDSLLAAVALRERLDSDRLASAPRAPRQVRLEVVTEGNELKKVFELSPRSPESVSAGFYTGAAQVLALRLCETLRTPKAAISRQELTLPTAKMNDRKST